MKTKTVIETTECKVEAQGIDPDALEAAANEVQLAVAILRTINRFSEQVADLSTSSALNAIRNIVLGIAAFEPPAVGIDIVSSFSPDVFRGREENARKCFALLSRLAREEPTAAEVNATH